MAHRPVVVEIAFMSEQKEKSRRRKLSEAERALWHRVVRSIAPLAPKPAQAVQRTSESPAANKKPLAPAPKRAPAPAATRVTRSAPPLEAFDRRQKQRLTRGTQDIDARIDLHGKTQGEAHGALIRFLRRAQRDGAKYVLVITGKGSRARFGLDDSGVLKRQVPHWLTLPEFRPYVVGFEGAHLSHGGEGALYVRVRKAPKMDMGG
jgi:DNA-nicking Smr family endonuclease